MRRGDLEAGRLMSEPLMGFDSNRKWRVRSNSVWMRRLAVAVAVTPRISRSQFERVIADLSIALGTVASTADDVWSRDHAARALQETAERVEGWKK